jgi:ABC-2 type transport system permease protein
VRTAGGANVIARALLFPLMFFAGLWLPRGEMSGGLLDISNFTPSGSAVTALQDSMLQGFPPVRALLVLAAYAVVFGLVARRSFRWE